MTPVATSPPMPVRWRRARPPNSEPAGVEMMLVGEPGPTRLLAHLPPAGEWRSLAEHRTVYLSRTTQLYYFNQYTLSFQISLS